MSVISIDGQFYFKFKIGNLDGFIDQEDLNEFTLIEEAGNVLPSFRINFETSNEDVLSYLGETHELEVSFGKSKSELVDAKLHTLSIQSGRTGNKRRVISASGLLSKVGYINNPYIYSYPSPEEEVNKKSGVEVIRDVITNFNEFTWDSNIEKSDDKMLWIQPNVSDKNFIDDVWIHSYLKNGSFLGVGISSDSTFILRDMHKLFKGGAKWKLTQNPENTNDIVYTDSALDIKTGFINSWVGYGRTYMGYSLDDDDYQFMDSETRPSLALTSEISRKATQERKWGKTVYHNENVHPKYWQAALRNITSLGVFSSIKEIVPVEGVFFPIKVLDLVMFKDDTVDPNYSGASRYNSGVYVVGKVSRQLTGKGFYTTLELYRESLNEVSGDRKSSLELEEPEDLGVGNDEIAENSIDIGDYA